MVCLFGVNTPVEQGRAVGRTSRIMATGLALTIESPFSETKASIPRKPDEASPAFVLGGSALRDPSSPALTTSQGVMRLSPFFLRRIASCSRQSFSIT